MWKSDAREGRGTMFYCDGSKEEGEWKNDYFIGVHTVTLASGVVKRRKWPGNSWTFADAKWLD